MSTNPAAVADGGATSATSGARAFQLGSLPGGRVVEAVTLSNVNGLEATIITLGASLRSLMMPDRHGERADVLLGPRDLADYVDRPQFFGSTVGRYANRIRRGRFSLDGREHQLSLNDHGNSLHGGAMGFDKVVWELAEVTTAVPASVRLRYDSEAGDQGYPGRVVAEAVYELDDRDHLTITYTATTDEPTIVNISNHAYWNLSGEGGAHDAMAHFLEVPAEAYLPTDGDAIPTGELCQVAGTPFDFRTPRTLGERIRDARYEQVVIARGYDHNLVVTREVTEEQHLMARLSDERSGRSLELWSNQPGLQLYSGNFLDGTTVGKGSRLYRAGDAIVLEPQLFPDTPNRPEFGCARLAPGETYRNVMTYRLDTGAGPDPQ